MVATRSKSPALRIFVDGREFTGCGNTGIGRYLLNLLTPLSRHQEIKLICCVSASGYASLAHLAGVEIVLLPNCPTLVADQWLLPRQARRHRADWFFSPYYKTPLWGRFKKIITIHDIMFLRLAHHTPQKRLAAAVQLKMATHCADLILVDSDFTAGELANYLPAVRPKIQRIYPALAPDWFSNAKGPGKAETTQPYFLYVGNFKPHKNVDLLINAFASWHSTAGSHGYRLILAGTDPVHTPRVEQLLQKLQAQAHVQLEKNVSEERLRVLYRHAHWFITASAYEGFGYPLVEAFATGCPAICHKNTALQEIAGEAALSIPELTLAGIKQALQTAATLPEDKRHAFIEAGRRRAQLFKAEAAAAAFLACLQ